MVFIYLFHKGGYVFGCAALCVFLFVSKSYERIGMKIYGGVRDG